MIIWIGLDSLNFKSLVLLKPQPSAGFLSTADFSTCRIEWFSKRTGTSFQNGARSKNVDKKLGRACRRVVLKSDLAVVATRIITSAF